MMCSWDLIFPFHTVECNPIAGIHHYPKALWYYCILKYNFNNILQFTNFVQFVEYLNTYLQNLLPKIVGSKKNYQMFLCHLINGEC